MRTRSWCKKIVLADMIGACACSPVAHASSVADIWSEVAGTVQSIGDSILDNWSNEEGIANGASRGVEEETNLNPSPSFDVTLLSDGNVLFRWDGDGYDQLVIRDEKHQVIVRQSVKGKDHIMLDMGTIGVKPGSRYTWALTDDPSVYQFSVLDAENEKKLQEALKSIENQAEDENTGIIEAATYLQYISDQYPDTVDLYWRSAQYLRKMTMGTEKQEREKAVLLQRCSNHLDQEM
ncbi:hypothetical protein [Selenomonas sp.]|uniref:hypothetical protein n=1 Tax=Selenomonas sp. TaxID=2053611 RepID=UPI0025D21FBA|nr:hypothetical protein [Selenomonas sp.]MCI6283951.1 hypothetical protein [Selenomonas sp.]